MCDADSRNISARVQVIWDEIAYVLRENCDADTMVSLWRKLDEVMSEESRQQFLGKRRRRA